MKGRFKIAVFFLLATILSRAQNVGIGISNPGRAKLELNGAVDATAAIFGGESSGISLQRNWPAVGFNHYYNGGDRYIGNGYAAKQYFDPNSGYMTLDLFPYGTANSLGSPVRAMVISPNGNLGLGNVLPNGTLQFTNTLNNRKIVLWETANNNNQFYGLGIDNGTLRYNIDGPGAAHRFYAATGSNGSQFLMGINGNKKVVIGTQDGGSKVGINSADPQYSLEIVQVHDQYENYGLLLLNALNNYHNVSLAAHSGSFGFDALNIYMGDASQPHILEAYIKYDGSYHQWSDERMKTNIKTMDSVLKKVMQLNPVSYEVKQNNPKHATTMGFIAQQVKPVFPDLVDVSVQRTNGLDQLHALNYSGFGVIAIKAIQEQQKLIEAQQSEITEMKKEISALKQKFGQDR